MINLQKYTLLTAGIVIISYCASAQTLKQGKDKFVNRIKEGTETYRFVRSDRDNLTAFLSDIYLRTETDSIYIKLIIHNSSTIIFPVDFFKIFKETLSKASDNEQLQTNITEDEIISEVVYKQEGYGKENVYILKIEKTSLAQNQILRIKIFEQNTDRNIDLVIKSKYFNQLEII